MSLKNCVHNIKNNDQVKTTTFSLFGIKLVTKIRITTCHHHQFTPLYRTKETDNKYLEMFIEKIEKDLFNPENVKKVRHNLSKDEKAALKDIRYWDKNVVRVQDKGSRFVVLDNEDYI